MKKLLSFAVPCYNSAEWMKGCVSSLLCAGEDTEIILIDDGSKDETGAIADMLSDKYVGRVFVHHQENGGHGEGVNQGIKLAQGKYYKVVDSDDRLDCDALCEFMRRLRILEKEGEELDMLICNYVYVRTDTGKRVSMNYKRIFPENRVFTWEDSRPFGPSRYLMMHSVIYRTGLLRERNVILPKHTFYVDNLYMYTPFPYVEKMYYMDLDLYLYSVGREEQSVSDKNVLKRIDQQILVTRLMIDSHDLSSVESRRLCRYMLHELSMMMSICDVFLEMRDTEENLKKIRDLWEHLREKDPEAYKKIRYRSVATLTRLPGKAGRKLTVGMYRIVKKIYKFN